MQWMTVAPMGRSNVLAKYVGGEGGRPAGRGSACGSHCHYVAVFRGRRWHTRPIAILCGRFVGPLAGSFDCNVYARVCVRVRVRAVRNHVVLLRVRSDRLDGAVVVASPLDCLSMSNGLAQNIVGRLMDSVLVGFVQARSNPPAGGACRLQMPVPTAPC